MTLDDEQAEKLALLARATHLNEGTLARSMLSVALDRTPLDSTDVVELLARIPGASDRVLAGIAEAEAGETVSLEEL